MSPSDLQITVSQMLMGKIFALAIAKIKTGSLGYQTVKVSTENYTTFYLACLNQWILNKQKAPLS